MSVNYVMKTTAFIQRGPQDPWLLIVKCSKLYGAPIMTHYPHDRSSWLFDASAPFDFLEMLGQVAS
jgi:hypothetical protein